MVVRQGFFSFFNFYSRFSLEVMIRQALLEIKHGAQHSSSILDHAFQSAILSTLSPEMVLCHPWQFLLVFHDSQVV